MSTGVVEAQGIAVPAARALVARTRAVWRRRVVVRAVVVSFAALACVAATLLLVDALLPLPAAARRVLRFAPVVTGLAPVLHAVRRLVPGPDDLRIALLVEERAPALEQTLSTALELRGDGQVTEAFRARAERALAGIDPASLLPARLRGAFLALGAGTVAGMAVVVFSGATGGELWARWRWPVDPPAPATAAPPTPSTPVQAVSDPRFGEIVVTIHPPTYTGLPARPWEGGDALAALAGSRVVLSGALPEGAEAVRAEAIGGGRPRVEADGAAWRVSWTIPAQARGLSLAAVAGDDVVARRVIPITITPDRPPAVTLDAPDRDLVLATPSGTIEVQATARDDYGVAALELSWIRSRGSGESFSFEEGTWAWASIERVAGGAVVGRYALDIAAAGLEPGDVLHLRATARDRNTVTGPGTGVSPTRVIRIADPDAMEEATTLIGFPLDLEARPILSQRMIILMTERLRDEAPGLTRQEILARAKEIADEQARLRGRVGDQIFTRATGAMQTPDEGIAFEETEGDAGHAHGEDEHAAEEMTLEERVLAAAAAATGSGSPADIEHRHDADPILDVNQPLLNAYNAMWAAERELRQGLPDDALPHQYEALAILQAQREAERVFLRGRQRVEPVDIGATRGTGKLDGADPADRAPGEPAPTGAAWLDALEAAATRLRTAPPREASLALAELAARILADPNADATAAALLGQAADAAARGERDTAAALVLRARTLLAPAGDHGARPPLPVAADPISADYFRRLGGR